MTRSQRCEAEANDRRLRTPIVVSDDCQHTYFTSSHLPTNSDYSPNYIENT